MMLPPCRARARPRAGMIVHSVLAAQSQWMVDDNTVDKLFSAGLVEESKFSSLAGMTKNYASALSPVSLRADYY